MKRVLILLLSTVSMVSQAALPEDLTDICSGVEITSSDQNKLSKWVNQRNGGYSNISLYYPTPKYEISGLFNNILKIQGGDGKFYRFETGSQRAIKMCKGYLAQDYVVALREEKKRAEKADSVNKSASNKGFSTTDANKFLVAAMDSCKSSGMFDGHKSLSKMSKSDIFYQTNTGRFKVSEHSLKMYEDYGNSSAKHYETCKYVASVIGKQKYVLSPSEVKKRKTDAAKARADKKAKQEAAAIAKAKAEAVEKAKAEAEHKALEIERARIAPINAEINTLSKELRSIENKTRSIAPRTTSVLVKSKMDNGAIQAIVNGELAAIVDIDGVITQPGYINLYLVKMKSLYTRKEAGFDIPVTTYGINADPERELREYKASAKGKADAKRAKEIELRVQELKSQL